MSVFRDKILEGRVALVTGGGSGIGAGIAKRLAEQGAKVGLLGRRAEVLEAVASEIRAAGGSALATPADVREYGEVEPAIERVAAEFGGLDILVNSAAGNFIAPAAQLSANGFKAVIGIDLLGTFNACRASFAHLSKRGRLDHQHFRASGVRPDPGAGSRRRRQGRHRKAHRDLALEWGSVGIRVNSVVPGPTEDTEGMRRLAPSDPEIQARNEACHTARSLGKHRRARRRGVVPGLPRRVVHHCDHLGGGWRVSSLISPGLGRMLG